MLLGSSVTGGLSINILSGDYRWRIVIAAMSVGAVLAVSSWLHRRPGSPVARWSIRILLTLALVASFLVLLGPAAIRSWSAAFAALLTAGAVLIPRREETAARILLGAATVGIGLTTIVITSDSLLIEGRPGMVNVHSLALTALGAAGVVLAWLALGALRPGPGVIGLGGAMAMLGLTVTAGGALAQGSGLVVGGVATTLSGLGWTKERYSWHGLGLIGIGVASLIIGASQIGGGLLLFGCIFVSHGTLVVVSGFGLLHGRLDVVHVAQLGVGLGTVVLGSAILRSGNPIYGVALLGIAAVGITSSLHEIRRGDLGRRVALWWHQFNTDPEVDGCAAGGTLTKANGAR